MKTWGDKRPDPAFSAIASRAVLRDAHVALKDFADALIDSDAARIRIRWLNCLALLRTIGHVLKDVDRDRSVWMAAAVDQKHREVMQNEFANLIFHEFIKKRARRNSKRIPCFDLHVGKWKAHGVRCSGRHGSLFAR